jgi:translocation and assembly module TamB
LASLEAHAEDVSVRSVGTVPFEYQNRVVRLERLRLQGDQLELDASGTVRIADEPVLNLSARGFMNLEVLNRLDPDYAAAGRVEIDAQVNGTARRPQPRGRLTISNADIHYGNLPHGLDNVNGSIVFDGTRGVLQEVTAETGGGRLRLTGSVRLEGGWQFNLASQVTDVRVRYPEGLNTWASGELTWSGSVESSLLEGRMVLTRQSVSRDFDLMQALARETRDDAEAPLPEILSNMRLRIELVSASQLTLDTATTRNLQTDIELQLQGTADQPVILGRIGIIQGEILFGGKRYAVNRGEISFVNPFRIEPLLSLSVQARVQRYDISMEFSGPPDRLTVTYRSDPPLPTRDILSLLVAGSAQESSLETTSGAVPQIGADTLLTQALRSQISGRLDRLFGTGRLRVDPQVSGLGGSTTTASIAVEQQFSDNFSVLYITDVTSAQQQTIQAEWNISSRLSVVGVRDQNGLIGVNFQITLRFR